MSDLRLFCRRECILCCGDHSLPMDPYPLFFRRKFLRQVALHDTSRQTDLKVNAQVADSQSIC
jgi:hypothetical protein